MALTFGFPPNSLSTIIRNRDKLRNYDSLNSCSKRRRTFHEDFDEAVMKWIHTMQDKHVLISEPFVIEKAFPFKGIENAITPNQATQNNEVIAHLPMISNLFSFDRAEEECPRSSSCSMAIVVKPFSQSLVVVQRKNFLINFNLEKLPFHIPHLLGDKAKTATITRSSAFISDEFPSVNYASRS
ncbi:tigger transposable element-derived protein 4 [Trichonephila clavipes]|nr:tigger transposable element-derived protein 4 [Trichonephila clavipes]